MSTPLGELCADHGGPEQNDDWCHVCEKEAEEREAAEAEAEKRREEREARIEAAWLAAGGVCSKRPLAHRMSGSSECTNVLEFLDQLCDCQVCEECGQPHNTGREAYAEDECQCLAGGHDW